MNTEDWVLPNKPNKCPYSSENLHLDPHVHSKWKKKPDALSILPNILHTIHNTPLIRINNITSTDGIECEILAKCEFLSAGGSVKDRIGLRMVEDAEEKNILQKGACLIEPTSGNTGIGLALTAGVKGYKNIIVIPEKMSKEKVDILKALGSEIVQTPTSASFASEKSNFGMSAKLLREKPKSYVLNQFRNAANAIAHYDHTAEEILHACEDRLDLLVCSIGTGGTLTGISRKIKERVPMCKVLAVDPVGSTMAQPEELNKPGGFFFEVEGIGGDFIPSILDRTLVDHWCKVADRDVFHMARRLIREEGLLCGGSSGAAMHCALEAVKRLGLGADKRVVVIMPDSIRNYLSKFVNDDWLRVRGLLMSQTPEEAVSLTWWRSLTVDRLKLLPLKTFPSTTKLKDALKTLKSPAAICAIEMISKKTIIGTLTGIQALRAVMAGKNELVLAGLADNTFKQVSTSDTLANLSVLFQYVDQVLVFQQKSDRQVLAGMVNKASLASFIFRARPKNRRPN